MYYGHYIFNYVLLSTHHIHEFFNFFKGDYNDLTEYLLNCNLTSLYNSSDVEEIWYILRSNILAGIEYIVHPKD